MDSAGAESLSMAPPACFDMDTAFPEMARRFESTLGKCRKYHVTTRCPRTGRIIFYDYGSMLGLLRVHYYFESLDKQDAAIIQSAVGLNVPHQRKREAEETDATIIQSAVGLDGPQERKRKREETDATLIQSAVGLDVPQEGKRKREDTDADLTQIDQRVEHILGVFKGRLSPSRFGPTVDEYGTFLDIHVRTPSPLQAQAPAVPLPKIGGQSDKALPAEIKLKEANNPKKEAEHVRTPSPLQAQAPAVPLPMIGGQSDKALPAEIKLKEANNPKKEAEHVRTPSPLQAQAPAVPLPKIGGQSDKALPAEIKLKEANNPKKEADHMKEEGDEDSRLIIDEYGSFLGTYLRTPTPYRDQEPVPVHVTVGKKHFSRIPPIRKFVTF